MKYIKLFEAFDSKALNATLKHIKQKADKKVFLDIIKEICRRFDIPESKLDDDLFSYLSFNRALRFNNVVIEDQPCDAKDEFIRGENCVNGKVKRAWGKGFRLVDCGVCKGTGIKPKLSNLSMIKFWFNSDGKYIATTAVDGIYRETSAANTTAFSPNLSDYDVVKRIPKTQMRNVLETGDIIAVDFVDRRWNGETYNVQTQIVAYVLKETRHGEVKLYALQNRSGRWPRPNDYQSWRQIGTESWTLTPSKCNNVNLLKPKSGVGLDPYGYNTYFDVSHFRTKPIQINSIVKDANFAIVLDFNKLMNLVPDKKKSEIIDSRKELKSNAIALISNEDIKKANIKRYFDKIAEAFRVVGNLDDVSKFNKMAARLFGSGRSVYFLNQATDTVSSRLAQIATYMFKVIKKVKAAEKEDAKSIEAGVEPTAVINLEKDRDFKDLIVSLNDNYSTILDWTLKGIDSTNKCLRALRDKITTDSGEWVDRDLKVLSNIDRLSSEIQSYISSIEVNTLDDVEYLLQEVYSIRALLRSERVGLSTLSSFFDRIRPSSYYNSANYLYSALTDKRTYYGNINNGIKIMINVIRKKQGRMSIVEDDE